MENTKDNNIQQKPISQKKDFSFFYDVAKLGIGNGITQVIRALLSPVISRLFLPEFFGIWQNFSSIANIFAVISSLRYDQSIMLPKEREEAANQFWISLLFTLITTPITIVIVWLFKDRIATLLNSPELAIYLWFVPVQMLAIGLFNVFKQWNARERKFSRLSIAQVENEVVADGMTVGFGFANLASSSTMIISRIAGQMLSSLTLGLLVLKEDGKTFINCFQWKKIRIGIKKYRKFPQFNIWAAFLSTLILYLPGILLSIYFSTSIAGYFGLGQSVLRLPVILIGNSIGQVFFQRAAKAFHKGKLASIVEETMKRLIVFGMFPMLMIMIIGEELFTIAFGLEWAEAGIYSQILSIWTLLIFFATPLNSIINILGKNEVGVFLNIIRVVTGAISLIIGGVQQNVYLGLWLFAITGTLTFSAFIIWVLIISGASIRKIGKHFLESIFLCIPFLLLIFFFQQFNPFPELFITRLKFSLQQLGLLFFSGIIGIIYYLVAIFRDASIKEILTEFFRKYKILQ